MKHIFDDLMKKMVKGSAMILPVLAVTFASTACIFKLYEPEMPEQLKK